MAKEDVSGYNFVMATFQFDDELTARLEQLATQAGASSVESYLRICAGLELPQKPGFVADDFDAELDALVDFGGPSLPKDFSRRHLHRPRLTDAVFGRYWSLAVRL
ncbi:MAG: hypothetical protein QM775_19710 [Pirellulales bacterium]